MALAALVCVAAGKKKQPPAHATVAGTVFRDPGFSFPGASVVLTRKDDPKHKKLAQAVSDERGEFRFPVPVAEATYVVTASHKGFSREEKEVTVSGPEEVDVNLSLTQSK